MSPVYRHRSSGRSWRCTSESHGVVVDVVSVVDIADLLRQAARVVQAMASVAADVGSGRYIRTRIARVTGRMK